MQPSLDLPLPRISFIEMSCLQRKLEQEQFHLAADSEAGRRLHGHVRTYRCATPTTTLSSKTSFLPIYLNVSRKRYNLSIIYILYIKLTIFRIFYKDKGLLL